MTKLTINGYENKIENKYYKIYLGLMEKRINEKLDENVYHEKHHILPRCLGGEDCSENIVTLTAKEHFIAHLLLTKFIKGGKERYKVLAAFFAMINLKSINTSERYITSRKFEVLRKEWADRLSEEMKGRSPFKDKKIHAKTMVTRKERGTNIWVTNNPMKDPIKAKKIASSRKGKNHYLVKKTKYEYSIEGKEWIEIDKELTIKEICSNFNWSVSTFNYILRGKTPKRGPMANIRIRKVINED